MKYVIGIDLGTSALKAVLFRADGREIASATELLTMRQPKNGWAEQDPEDWYRAAIAALKHVMASGGVDREQVASIGLSGQMHGLVMLDRAGAVLRPCILWCDQRTKQECEELTRCVGSERLIEITANPALTGFTASKILWVKHHEPEIFANCRHILLPKDYLRYRLSGVFATDVSDASGMQLLDVPRRAWSGEMAEVLGIPLEYLPKLYESCEVTAGLSEKAAGLTGLAPGTPIVAGAGDNAAAAVGTGTVQEGRAFTTIGTSGVVYAHTEKPMLDPRGRVHTFCCAVPGCWHVMGVTQGAGLSLQWFRNQFCGPEQAEAEQTGRPVYTIMDEEAGQIPIGADRLLYLPYLMGERTPHLDPDCRGAFLGISAMHTRAHFIRAVMEGVTYSLCDCLSVMREMGLKAETMLVTGGGGKSALWRQMLCDAFNLPVKTAGSSEGPALGAAILAAVGGGLYSDVLSACAAMVKESGDCRLPVSENTAQYRRCYEVYRSLYGQLKPVFQALLSI
ncbi:MAG TPA: xylulokinase [Candidatus Onthovicinus excrementipullorum]|nr:xylulokinase [Candidatus Onthovicinus excrementipullorum]